MNTTTNNQVHGNYRVSIMKNTSGQRAAKIETLTGRRVKYVPIELLSICAGPDAWMRNILVKCCDCREIFLAHELVGSGICESCADASIAADEV